MTDLKLLATRPSLDEYHPFYGAYVEAAAARGRGSLDRRPDPAPDPTPDPAPDCPLDIVALLAGQPGELEAALGGLAEEDALHRYAPGKWSVKEVVAHLADVERVMSYRLLRVGRGDATPLPGFDENAWIEGMGHDRRSLADHLEEFRLARAATVALVRGFGRGRGPEAFMGTVVASGHPVSGRALVWILAGHAEHHLQVLHERYGVPHPGPSGHLPT